LELGVWNFGVSSGSFLCDEALCSYPISAIRFRSASTTSRPLTSRGRSNVRNPGLATLGIWSLELGAWDFHFV
jgi:hypothetical protein